ncbi:hypothetical protein HORIV_37930 [Vreelandella olivaria]|uniref:Uncharacterized protein n=1 Tax=Vreelandella olivaria TaxID=390919 RepID=A0ABN5WX05_9GAMM|nr:hypothetical protein HORIV_37930 [Halomonas olivaria]
MRRVDTGRHFRCRYGGKPLPWVPISKHEPSRKMMRHRSQGRIRYKMIMVNVRLTGASRIRPTAMTL